MPAGVCPAEGARAAERCKTWHPGPGTDGICKTEFGLGTMRCLGVCFAAGACRVDANRCGRCGMNQGHFSLSCHGMNICEQIFPFFFFSSDETRCVDLTSHYGTDNSFDDGSLDDNVIHVPSAQCPLLASHASQCSA